jgi:hypothetical protein
MQDNSSSEKFAFKKIDSIAYRKNVAALIADLEKDYTVKEYSYGSTLTDTVKHAYNENSTDLSSALEKVMTTLENKNLGGIILAGDGIYNKGSSPLNLNYPFQGAMYTIGLGDTTIQRDALVARVFANKVVYLGDQFAIRSDVAAYACKGENLNVSIFSHQDKRVIASQNMNANSDHFSKAIETIIDTKVAGVQHFTITISKVIGEQNIANNTQEVYVEVIDSKENVLIVANSPHPDVFALKEALSKNKNYKVDIASADKMNKPVGDYNLIILHNIPSANYNGNSIIEQAQKQGISLWYITGAQTAIPLLNKIQTCLQISTRGFNPNEVQAMLNKDFSYFTINPNADLNNLPPLSTPFGDFTAGPNTQTLLMQKVGSVATNYPLWVVQQNANSRVGVLAGEGIWRWRLYDYYQHKNQDIVDDFILKTAQYLSVKHDKRQFRTVLPKSVFTESETVSFDAELYNENYELINTPDVNLNIVDEANKKSTFSMNKDGNSYSLNAGNLAAGKYSYTSSTSFNGKTYSANGTFTIVAQNIEEVNTTADFGLLNQLAKNYGGEFVFPNQVMSLRDKIRNNPHIKTVLHSTVNNDPLINWKWLFALLILLLSAEWFIRKRSGNY